MLDDVGKTIAKKESLYSIYVYVWIHAWFNFSAPRPISIFVL